MLKLYLSTNLGVTYKIIEKFTDLAAAHDYLADQQLKLGKARWFLENEKKQIILACPIFHSVAYQVDHNSVSISDDKYLKRYLRQTRFDRVKEQL